VIAEGDWSVEREPRDDVWGAGRLQDVRLNSAEQALRQHERDNPPLVGYFEDIQRRRGLRGLATDERSAEAGWWPPGSYRRRPNGEERERQ